MLQPQACRLKGKRQVEFVLVCIFVTVNNPAALIKEHRQLIALLKLCLDQLGIPSCYTAKFAVIIRFLPKQSRGRTDNFREGLYSALADRQAIGTVVERFGQPQPLFPVVVLVLVEMLADEDTQARPDSVRREQNKQQQYRAAEENDLRKRRPATAKVADKLPNDPDKRKVDAGAENCRRMEHYLARHKYAA